MNVAVKVQFHDFRPDLFRQFRLGVEPYLDFINIVFIQLDTDGGVLTSVGDRERLRPCVPDGRRNRESLNSINLRLGETFLNEGLNRLCNFDKSGGSKLQEALADWPRPQEDARNAPQRKNIGIRLAVIDTSL